MVIAAGNEGYDLDSSKFSIFYWPQQIRRDWSVVVAATQEGDWLTNWSNVGSVFVQIAAPGQDIYTTLPSAWGGYGYGNGTSFSAPIVSGVAALALTTHPWYSASQLKNQLLNSADFLVSMPSGAVEGSRRVNAYRAVYP